MHDVELCHALLLCMGLGSLVPSPLPSAILTKAQKVIWQTEPTFLGLVTSHFQNREYQSDCRSVTCWEMAYSRLRTEAALSSASHCLGYQHLMEKQREAIIHLVSGKDMFFPFFPCVIPSCVIGHNAIRPRNVGSVCQITFRAFVKMTEVGRVRD